MNNRSLKACKGHWDSIPKRTPCGGKRVAPFMLLKGLLLEQAGFPIDTPVSITVEGEVVTLFHPW
ncbi:hypothetical protein [Vreelandella boliviensis]|uniref:hypothetical protein n=1 Tax=Vreelandella boliviensis TaxID=223527 RepID=UPI001B8B9D10|nr:hypothetical protein [Halomonas boliviensis]MBS3666621.1 hypothetical protein [Halomonas boliviensis]